MTAFAADPTLVVTTCVHLVTLCGAAALVGASVAGLAALLR